MTFPPFQPRPLFLLPSPSHSQGRDHDQKQKQQPPPLTVQDLIGVTWHMIASSSSMWLDRKHSITINYSTDDGRKLTEVTTWHTDKSTQQSSTKGVSSPIATESGYVYDWRGAGWLRLITTQWEIVGLGVLSYPGGDGGESEVAAMVTFVQKTIFSPPGLSVLIIQPEAHVHGTQKESIIKAVVAALRSLGVEALGGEIDKLKTIPDSTS